ncbi:MAG: T9SS type A sorting domain-containing protein, partial [Bacteroidota bacterium]
LTCDPTLIGIDTASFINQLGCDSLIITTTTLQGISDTTKLRIETCDFNSIGLDTLFLSNQSGCDSLVITERFFAFPSPPIIEFSSESPVCQGDTILLSTNSYDSGLQWIKNGAEIDGAISTQLVVTEAGTYGLSYTNEEGCAVVASTVTFSFLEAPEVPIFTNENNLLSLENLEVFENLDLQWFYEGNPIEGATNATYCSSRSGGYSLVATNPNTNCSKAFALFVEQDENIENCVVNTNYTSKESSILVYPNPHQSYFTLELKTRKTTNLKIVNLLGQIVHQKSLSGQYAHTISSADWTPGVYYISVEWEGKTETIKVIKAE